MSIGQPVEPRSKRTFVIWFIALLAIGWALVFKDQLDQAKWVWYGFLLLLAVMLLWVFEKNPAVVLAVLLAGMLLVFLYRAYGGQGQEPALPEPESQPVLAAAVPTAEPEPTVTPVMPVPTPPDCSPDGAKYVYVEPGGFIHSDYGPLALYVPSKELYLPFPDGTSGFFQIGLNTGSQEIWLKIWNVLCEGWAVDYSPPAGLIYRQVDLNELIKKNLVARWPDKPTPTD